MKKMIAVTLVLALAGAPVRADERTPKWFKWVAGGALLGASSLFMARESHRWRVHGMAERREGDRIFDARENKYGLTYQERARSKWDEAAGLRGHARRLKYVSAGLAVLSVSALGVGVTYGAGEIRARKSVRFR